MKRQALVWLLLILLLSSSCLQAADRPNILFAFADDWGRYASAYAKTDAGPSINQVVKTPNFDAIAKTGVLFKQAYVTRLEDC